MVASCVEEQKQEEICDLLIKPFGSNLYKVKFYFNIYSLYFFPDTSQMLSNCSNPAIKGLVSFFFPLSKDQYLTKQVNPETSQNIHIHQQESSVLQNYTCTDMKRENTRSFLHWRQRKLPPTIESHINK